LILLGGFATGVNKNPNLAPADRERFAAMKTLMKLGWGSDDPTSRQFFYLFNGPQRSRPTPSTSFNASALHRHVPFDILRPFLISTFGIFCRK
jgi:hypothetical protein